MHRRVGTGSRTMADLVALAMARHGGKPALMHKVDGEWVEVSYEQLEGRVRELALGLVDLGIEPGDRVSILSHTRPEWTYAGLRRLPLARLSCRSTRRTRQRSATTCCITPGRERCCSRTPSRWRRSAPSRPCWVADPRRARSCLAPTLDCTSGARSGGETCLCCRHSRVRPASPQRSANRVGRRERLANLCHGAVVIVGKRPARWRMIV